MEAIFTADGHCDTMLRIMNDPEYDFFSENKNGHLDLPRLQKGGVGLQVMALFVESKFKPFQALPRTLEMAGAFHGLIDSNRENLSLITSREELNNLGKNPGKTGLLLALEGGEALCSTLSLYSFFKLGLRLVTLTWNQRNQLADGVGETCTGGGLTRLGREIVGEMNRLGIGVDVSHLSEKSFWDVAQVCEKPLIASHSNAFSVCNHPRNLKDEQITAIVESGGIIGINFSSYFLNGTKGSSIEDVLNHIDYIIEGWGFDFVGMGSDFDGIGFTPVELKDVTRFPVLARELITRYGKSNAEKIMGANWLMVLDKILRSS